MRPPLEPVTFGELPGWAADDPAEVIPALARCARHVIHVKPYRTGALGLACDDLLLALRAAEQAQGLAPAAARRFFEDRFLPFRIASPGFVTGYYEPELAVSAVRTARYCYPIYRRPDDLIDIDHANKPAGMDPYFAFARSGAGGISEYFDRRAIDQGALEARGLEIAFAESRIDLFFVHIQGAARLIYADGRRGRITYAAKTGHPFTPIGRLLIERSELAREAVTMATIRAWLEAHPDQVDELLWQNRSYIFFRETPANNDSLGPVAAAKVPLSSGRSLAVDRTIHTFATPIFVSAPDLTHLDEGKPFRRLMLAQDTGSAIVGPARGDIFTGSGVEAGQLAGSIKHEAAFYVLIPKTAAERFL
ncbi:MAG TPA: murein transglycosylase A [Pararhizobium sp.]|nr:murein transglycosylase A [Pararhizobium sp.]